MGRDGKSGSGGGAGRTLLLGDAGGAGRGGRGGAPGGRGRPAPPPGGPDRFPFVAGAPHAPPAAPPRAPGPARGRRPGPTPAEYSRRAAPLAPSPGRLRARARFRPLFLPEEERGSCLLSSEYVFGVPCLLLPRRRPPPRARLRLRLPVIFVWRPRAPGSTLGGAAAPGPGRSCRRAAGRGAGA